MIEHVPEVAASVVAILHSHFLAESGLAVAKSAASEAGKSLVSWVKSKFTSPSEADALAKFEANPESNGAKAG